MKLRACVTATVLGFVGASCTPEAPPPPKAVSGAPPAAASEVVVQPAVTADGVHVRVLRDTSPDAGVSVELLLGQGESLSGTTDRLGSVTLVPSLAQLFAGSESGMASVRTQGKSAEVNLSPMIQAASAKYPDEWAELTRDREQRYSRADQAIGFVGPVYRDKNREPLIEDCQPSGAEICGDGIDNDCSGRYDDASCGYHTGVVQFTATWRGDADVDLHVVGPDMLEVWRERPTNDKLKLVLDRSCKGGSGGSADCPAGNVENAYVPATEQPTTGTYQAWIELNSVGQKAEGIPLPVTFSGRIGSHYWRTLVKLAPIPGASYQVAIPLGSDQDHDSVTDPHDACPTTAGCWFDDVAHRGCPDIDEDAVPDAIDACPNAPGVDNPSPNEHGCPLVFGDASVTNEGVRITSRIEFAFGRAELKPESNATLENVTRAILAHPSKLELLAVDGHTDEVGTEQDNVSLSEDRAKTVIAALVKLGIPEAKLTARGFGETQPRADNETARGRQSNRRVEFLALEPRGTVSTCFSVPKPSEP